MKSSILRRSNIWHHQFSLWVTGQILGKPCLNIAGAESAPLRGLNVWRHQYPGNPNTAINTIDSVGARIPRPQSHANDRYHQQIQKIQKIQKINKFNKFKKFNKFNK